MRCLGHIASLLFTLAFAQASVAQPQLIVSPLLRPDENSFHWEISVAPDSSLFASTEASVQGGAMAIELGISVEGGTILSLNSTEDTQWPFETIGMNPFIGEISEGIWLDENRAFISLGSQFLTDDEATQVAWFTTEKSTPQTIRWGNYIVNEGTAFERNGGRLAQSGFNFDNQSGAYSVGLDPLDCTQDGQIDRQDVACATGVTINEILNELGLFAGDLDLNGNVSFADFLVLSTNFGETVSLYSEGDINLDGTVGFTDFLMLSENFGRAVPAKSVPEPNSFQTLILISVLLFLQNAKRRQGSMEARS